VVTIRFEIGFPLRDKILSCNGGQDKGRAAVEFFGIVH